MESEYLKRIKEEEFEIGRLRKYGELISEYPNILKFLYIEKLSDKIEVIVLPQDEKTGFPEMLEHIEDVRAKDLLPEEPSADVPEKSFSPERPKAAPDFPEEPEKEIKVQPEVKQEVKEKKKFDLLKYLKFWEFIKIRKN
jgi:hypothetical protein